MLYAILVALLLMGCNTTPTARSVLDRGEVVGEFTTGSTDAAVMGSLQSCRPISFGAGMLRYYATEDSAVVFVFEGVRSFNTGAVVFTPENGRWIARARSYTEVFDRKGYSDMAQLIWTQVEWRLGLSKGT
jgi:hypothetical protein